jgi:hypothetical protein
VITENIVSKLLPPAQGRIGKMHLLKKLEVLVLDLDFCEFQVFDTVAEVSVLG